jgi:hypothetical protein
VLLPVLPLAATAAVAGHAAGSTYAAAATDKLQLQWTSQLLAGWIVAGTGKSLVAEGNAQGLQRGRLLPSQCVSLTVTAIWQRLQKSMDLQLQADNIVPSCRQLLRRRATQNQQACEAVTECQRFHLQLQPHVDHW